MSEKGRPRVELMESEASMALAMAIERDDAGRLAELFAAGVDPDCAALDEAWELEESSVFGACAARMSEACLRAFLEAGASVDSESGLEQPPLASVVGTEVSGSLGKVRALLEFGASPGGRSARGDTALELALRWARPTSGAGEEALLVVKELLAAGADPNECGAAFDARLSPLALACRNESPSQVAALLAAGADPRRGHPRHPNGQGSAESFMQSRGRSEPAEAIRALLKSAVERLELDEATPAGAPRSAPRM